MKTARQINITFTLVSTILAGLIIAALSHGTSANQNEHSTLGAPSQVVTIVGKKLSIAEKLHYDTLAAVGAETDAFTNVTLQPAPVQTVVITAKRLTNEQKIAMDAAHARQLQANTQYNTLLRKTV